MTIVCRNWLRIALLLTLLTWASVTGVCLGTPIAGVLGRQTEAVLASSDIGQTYEIDVESATFYAMHINFTRDSGIYGDFVVTEGTNITLFILDGQDYDQFKNLQPHNANVAIEKQSAATILFKPPETATWHIVLNNRYSSAPKHMRLYLALDQTPPSVTTNMAAELSYDMSITARFVVTETRFYLYVKTLVDSIEFDEHLTTSQVHVIDIELRTLDTGYHTVRIEVSDTVGNSDEFTIGFYVSTSGPTDGGVVGKDLALYIVAGVAVALLVAAVVCLIRHQATTGPQHASQRGISAARNLGNREMWSLVLESAEDVFKGSKQVVWEFTLKKILYRLVDEGRLGISHKKVGDVVAILVETGLLRLTEDDSLVMTDDYDSRKSEFLSRL